MDQPKKGGKMAANIIDGKAKAAELAKKIKEETAILLNKDIIPGLAVIIIGDNPASNVYVKNKKRTAEACGFYSTKHSLAESAEQKDIIDLIQELNNNPKIHGILIQLPLPPHLDENIITQSISPSKDVDGFHYRNIGKLHSGNVNETFVPCTPAGCMLMIEDQIGKDLSGLNAVVIGRSNIVGKPMASLLLQANATVTICHSRTKNLPDVVRQADIVVAAVGQPNMVKGSWIKDKAIVIDVGINRLTIEEDGEKKSKLTGDVDFEEASKIASAITPVPGGVGPMTIAMLMENTLIASTINRNDEQRERKISSDK